MDEIDFGLCMSLMVNSRIAYRELAETFNMSVNSIHKRIKSLVNLDIIHNFNTKLDLLNFPNIVNAIMFGNSKIENKDELLDKLGKHECIFNVTRASGSLYYIHAYLKDFSRLNPLISFIQQEGEIKNLKIGLDSTPPFFNAPTTSETNHSSKSDNLVWQKENRFTALDFLIINSLKDHSRKAIADIADEVGTTPKTVRRHLNNMIEKKLLEFSIEWYPDKSSIIISIIILKLDPNAELDKSQIMEEMHKDYGQMVLFSWNLNNLPNLMLVCVWTHSMKELQELEASLISKNFNSVNATVLVKGKMYPTWRDTYLEEKIKKIKENKV
ncbi:MAG: winged helix-turn-helix transcriptional regulator [Candidatus Lokiarchaeota archaeon]|nr:winged helix-turn-helix transcriptional regulator [Candidatus Lokiarchaeota archaeon]